MIVHLFIFRRGSARNLFIMIDHVTYSFSQHLNMSLCALTQKIIAFFQGHSLILLSENDLYPYVHIKSTLNQEKYLWSQWRYILSNKLYKDFWFVYSTNLKRSSWSSLNNLRIFLSNTLELIWFFDIYIR